jgi:hypothetical protein
MVDQELNLDDQWLTAEQTAEQLGISINNLRQIQHRKQLKWGKREGRKVHYKLNDVMNFLAKRRPRNQ